MVHLIYLLFNLYNIAVTRPIQEILQRTSALNNAGVVLKRFSAQIHPTKLWHWVLSHIAMHYTQYDSFLSFHYCKYTLMLWPRTVLKRRGSQITIICRAFAVVTHAWMQSYASRASLGYSNGNTPCKIISMTPGFKGHWFTARCESALTEKRLYWQPTLPAALPRRKAIWLYDKGHELRLLQKKLHVRCSKHTFCISSFHIESGGWQPWQQHPDKTKQDN